MPTDVCSKMTTPCSTIFPHHSKLNWHCLISIETSPPLQIASVIFALCMIWFATYSLQYVICFQLLHCNIVINICYCFFCSTWDSSRWSVMSNSFVSPVPDNFAETEQLPAMTWSLATSFWRWWNRQFPFPN